MAFSGFQDAQLDECSPVAQANNQLAVLLYKELAREGGNLFFSPFSLSSALAMLYCGSGGHTETEMKQVLGFKDAGLNLESIHILFKDLLQKLDSGTDDYLFACANSVVSHRDLKIKDHYRILLEGYFDALLKQVDFVNNSQEALTDINKWVKEKTNGMIPQLLDSLDSSTVMVILNAVYFKGLWLNQFKKKDTFMQYFYNNGEEDNAKLIDMMHLKEKFPYFEGESYKVLQLPYKGNSISMLVVLPNARNGLVEIESLLTSSFMQDLKQHMRLRKVEVSMPQMKLEYSKSMRETLQKLGMNHAFTSEANFSSISDSEKICVSDVIHKAVLEVNEEGSEAAAATAVLMARYCMPVLTDDPEFIVDHPFLVLIYNTKENIILFCGRVEKL